MKNNELLLRIFLAVILPPLGLISLPEVGCGTLLLSCLLTLCFYLPGLIASLIIITRTYASQKQTDGCCPADEEKGYHE